MGNTEANKSWKSNFQIQWEHTETYIVVEDKDNSSNSSKNNSKQEKQLEICQNSKIRRIFIYNVLTRSLKISKQQLLTLINVEVKI